MSAPQLSLSQFLEQAGHEQAVTAVKLWENPEISYIVLFADANGKQLAVLPIGAKTDYKDLNTALGAEIEGLRAQCWTFSLTTLWAVWTQGMVQKSEVEDKLAQTTKKEQQVEERLADLERLAESIEERQKYIEESENRLASRAQELTEMEARIEQARSDMDDKRRRTANEKPGGPKFEPAGAARH